MEKPEEIPSMIQYQNNVGKWLTECFGADTATNSKERAMRFLEEAVELVQAFGMNKQEASKVIQYVYDRKVGEKEQEVGGVMVTLASLCYSSEIDLNKCAVDEFTRINTDEMKEKMRAKQDFKRSQGLTFDSENKNQKFPLAISFNFSIKDARRSVAMLTGEVLDDSEIMARFFNRKLIDVDTVEIVGEQDGISMCTGSIDFILNFEKQEAIKK